MADNEYYVYRLIDPRNKNTFYVGKGKGDRVFAHVKNALKDYNGHDYRNIENGEIMEDEINLKSALIREIHNQGMEVEAIIHSRGLDEKTAYAVETALINAYPGLTNSVKGHKNTDQGPMPVENIKIKLSTEDTRNIPPEKNITSFAQSQNISRKITVINDRCVIIKIHHETILERGSVYEAVRWSWRALLDKARYADYVLAIVQGTVLGVFKPTHWYRATAENARKYGGGVNESRISFIGEEANDIVKNLYINKEVPDKFLPSQNPIQYTY
ncbi:hypothetical protein FACS189450_08920 [Spirochaetia bacterium]|nr:hypothetical protein FACS189450_08920 [Spirochaetia bacterium]